jgi:hypothetical protein
MTEETAEQKLARYETVLDLQMKELDRLRAENERLRDGADAHSTLQSIYRNPASPEGNRIKAAAASLPVEKPKLISIGPPIELNRRERWRVFEMWSQRRQYIIEHRAIPPLGWDAHLERDTFQEPPGDALPPVDVIEDPTSGFKVLSNLLPQSGQRRLGNGNGDDSSND